MSYSVRDLYSLFSIRRVLWLTAALAAVVALAVSLSITQSSRGFVSSEVKFADASASGFSIVPASCPSNPHWVGECAGITGGGCNITASPASIYTGDSSTLQWTINDLTYYLMPVSPSNIKLSSVGVVGRYDSQTVSPSQTTRYTLSGDYIILSRVLVGSFSCSRSVQVSTNCPPGKVSYQGQCLNDCPDGTVAKDGICVPVQCPTGFVLKNGVCEFDQCPAGYRDAGVGANPRCIPNQCIASYICKGSTLYYRDTSCTDSFVQQCPFGCANGACNPAPKPGVDISVNPTLIRSGESATVQWVAHDVSNCTVSGSNGDSWTGVTGSKQTSAIRGQTIYTVSCQGFDGTTATDRVTVNITPIFNER